MTHDTEVAAARGEFHFQVSRAALCAEPECGTVFALPVRSSSDGAHRCPACGGAHFILIEAALQASGVAKDQMEQRMAAVENILLDLIEYAKNPRTAKGWYVQRIADAEKALKR